MRYRLKLLIAASALLCLSAAAQAVSYGSVTKTLYIDGALAGQATASQALSYPFNRLTIAAEGSRTNPYNGLIGIMDEFAVYGKVLTAAQIKAHYDANDTNAAYVAAVQASGPKLWLRFEDASSDNNSIAANSGSDPNVYGTYIGDTNANDINYGNVQLVTGRWGGTQAADFNGASNANGGTCVDVNDALKDLSIQQVTVEFWVWTDQNDPNGAYPRFFQHNGDSAEQRGYGAMHTVTSGAPSMGVIGGGSTSYLARYINDSSWHHVAVTYDSMIPVAGQYYNEVMADDPCLWLRFGDDPCGYDDSTSHHYYVQYGSATTQNVSGVGGIGKCVQLKGGTQSYVYASKKFPPDFNVGTPTFDQDNGFAPNDVTFEFWYRDIGIPISNWGNFFNQCVGTGHTTEEYPPILEQANWTSTYYYTRYAYNGAVGYANQADSMQYPLDGKWHMIDMSFKEKDGYDDAMTITLYKDGVSIKTKTYGHGVGTTGFPGVTGPEMSFLVIGNMEPNSGARNMFSVPGYFDEFAIYGTVLSSDRIYAHWIAGQPKTCAQMRERGMGYVGDLNWDCAVDFIDFATFAESNWKKCNDPCDANCVQNW